MKNGAMLLVTGRNMQYDRVNFLITVNRTKNGYTVAIPEHHFLL